MGLMAVFRKITRPDPGVIYVRPGRPDLDDPYAAAMRPGLTDAERRAAAMRALTERSQQLESRSRVIPGTVTVPMADPARSLRGSALARFKTFFCLVALVALAGRVVWGSVYYKLKGVGYTADEND